MAMKKCEKCGETVDEAKAFCPACGNALVEEQTRETASNFESMDNTVQFGQTMYNQMLADMGLDISKPKGTKAKVETIQPVAEIAPLPAPAPTPVKAGTVRPAVNKNRNKWLIAASILFVLIIGFVIVILIAAFLILPRLNR